MDESKQPKTVRTVADALREMPVGTRFTRQVYKSTSPWVKIGEDVFSDGVITMTGRRFMYQSRPADDPDNGIIILSTPDAVPPTRVRCWKGVYNNMWYMESEHHGHYIRIDRQCTEISAFTISGLNERNSAGLNQEITPAAALDLLKDWPEGRELFLAYCREHPPVEEPKPTVDVTCKVCGNVMKGLTPGNIAYCMDCGTDSQNPLNLEQPVYAQVMGRGSLSRQYKMRCNELIDLTHDKNLLLSALVRYGQHTGSCAAFPATSPAQIIVDCNCGLMDVLAKFRKSEPQ